MLRLLAAVLACLMVLAALLIVVDPSLAQDLTAQQANIRPISPRAGPAPLLGVGLPLFAGVLAVLILARGYWRKE
jgi:hypothetical protein